MKEIILATHNKHKLEEVRQILEPLDFVVKSADDYHLSDVEETGETFADNAILKAISGCKETGKPVIADDSGISICGLNNQPGVYSARYAVANGGYPAVFDVINKELGDNPNRKAFYTCVIALAYSETEVYTFTGEMHGSLAKTYSGTGGFGYDPLFIPDGFDTTLGHISAEEKNKISHRGKALEKLYAFLKERNG